MNENKFYLKKYLFILSHHNDTENTALSLSLSLYIYNLDTHSNMYMSNQVQMIDKNIIYTYKIK